MHGSPGELQLPSALGASARHVASKLTDVRKVIRVGGGIALLALVFLPQVSCMGESMTALGLLNLARNYDAMTGARDLFLWVWVFSVFAGAIWALTARARLAGWVGGVAQVVFMARIAQSQALQLEMGAYLTLFGFAVVVFAPKIASWAVGFSHRAGEGKGLSAAGGGAQPNEPRGNRGETG
ncbi:MAG: hypothetical protein ACK42L_04150 [Thermoanaerobaculum sp.]